MKRIITLLLLVFTFNISASALFSPPVCVTESKDTVGRIIDATGIICDNYLWNGLFITVSGDYVATLPNANSAGCDSIAYLHAIIENSTSTDTLVTACDSYTWAINGQTYNTSGIKIATSTNAAQCTHTDILDLTIDYSHIVFDTVVTCNSYTWIDGNTYTSSTTSNTLFPSFIYNTSIGGCDSTIYLYLTINDSTFNTNSQTVCDSYTWAAPLGNGNTYTIGGIYTHVSTNAQGCQHTETLNLTINLSSDTNDVSAIICNFYEDDLGNIYDTSAVYTYTMINSVGCDSVIRLDLTVNFPDSSFTMHSACDSYTWNGTTYTISGLYPYNTTTVGGCDSVAMLDLFVGYSEIHVNTVSACDNYVWYDAYGDTIKNSSNQDTALSGHVPGNYGIAGVFNDTVSYNNIGGCDSIVVLNLTLSQNIISQQTQPIDIYSCDSWINPYDGQVITTSGLYALGVASAPGGCDSLKMYDIHITAEKRDDIFVTECDTFIWIIEDDQGVNDTTVYTSSTIDSVVYTGIVDSFPGNNGNPTGYTVCDSVVYLHLTITNSEVVNITAAACDSYWWNGITYTTSGTYAQTLTNVAQCDSVVSLTLTINNSTSGTTVIDSGPLGCDSYLWAPPLGNGNTYTTSGTHIHVSTNAVGCDHTETLILTINPNYTVPFALNPVVSCDSYHWPLAAGGNGVTYYTTGVYSATFPTVSGCDSTVILDLTIDYPDSIVDQIVACDSYTWIDGNTYTSSNNTASYTYPTALGVCDSIIYLDLTIYYTSSTHTVMDTCDSYTWSVNGVNYDSTGIYTNTYTNASGCLHTDSLDLTINYSNSGSHNVTTCDSYTWNNTTYTTSGTYQAAFQNVSGCDSVHTLTLIIDNTVVTYDTATSCDSYTWNPPVSILSFTFDTTSTFNAGVNSLDYWVMGNSNGNSCLDTSYLYLTIYPTITHMATIDACSPYTWNGTTYDSTGIYIDTLISAALCDSIVTLHLTVDSNIITPGCTDSIACNYFAAACVDDGSCTYPALNANCSGACLPGFVSVNGVCVPLTPSWDCVGNTCVNPGNGQGTYSSLAACNAVCGAPAPSWNCVSPGNCQDPGTGNGTYPSLAACQTACPAPVASWNCVSPGNCQDPGTGNGTYPSLAACQTACPAPVASWDCVGSTCIDPGTGNGTYASLAACQTACGVTPSWDCVGATCIDPGTGNGIYPSLAACNAVCGVATPSWDCVGTTCIDPGTGNGTYNSLAACQAVCSIVSGCTDSLACNYNPLAVIDDGSCLYGQTNSTNSATECDTYTWNGSTYTSSGTYTFTTINAAGCDSIATLNLVILNGPSVLIQQNASNMSMLDAVVTGGAAPLTYSWTQDGVSLSSTGSQIEPLENGEYCVVVADAVGCISTACFTISFFPPNSINEFSISKLKIYPNPTSNMVNLEFTTKKTSDYDIRILSVTGIEVYSNKLLDVSGSYKGMIDMSSYSQGTYIIHIISDDNIVYRKLIKQ